MIKTREALKKYNINPKKYTIKNKRTIIDSNEGKYTLKNKENKNLNELYRYLASRSFNYYPELISDEQDEYDIEKYINDIKSPIEERAIDLIQILALLHTKTTHYKTINIDEVKKIYEELNSKLEYLYNYYNDITEVIESKIYMAPSEYLIVRNITLIFNVINYCKNELEEWYKIKKTDLKERVVYLHGNVSLDHILKDDKTYLISWNNSKIDSPIYDFIQFYNKKYNDLDYESLLRIYEQKYPLQEAEKKLMLIILSIPTKIELTGSEYETCKKVTDFINNIYQTEKLLTPRFSKKSKDTIKE